VQREGLGDVDGVPGLRRAEDSSAEHCARTIGLDSALSHLRERRSIQDERAAGQRVSSESTGLAGGSSMRSEASRPQKIEERAVPEVVWADDVPDEVRHAVLPHLRRALVLVPRWCEKIAVRWEEGADGIVASMGHELGYRKGVLGISPAFLSCDKNERWSVIVHEMCHLLMAPADTHHRALIDHMLRSQTDESRRFVVETRREAIEATVCDLESVLLALLGQEV